MPSSSSPSSSTPTFIKGLLVYKVNQTLNGLSNNDFQAEYDKSSQGQFIKLMLIVFPINRALASDHDPIVSMSHSKKQFFVLKSN